MEFTKEKIEKQKEFKNLNLNAKSFVPKDKRVINQQENTNSNFPHPLSNENTSYSCNDINMPHFNKTAKSENSLKFKLDSKEFIPKSKLNINVNAVDYYPNSSYTNKYSKVF